MNYKQPPYSEKYPLLLSLYNDEPAVAKNNKLINNISYLGRWLDLNDGLDLNTVLSENNIVAKSETEYKNPGDHIIKKNPGMYNYNKEDFRLKPKALKYGFREISYGKIGLQQDAFRKKPTKTNTE